MEEEIAGEEGTDPAAAEAELMEHLQEEIRNLPVSDHLLYMLHSLSALAVGRMGVTADTAVRRDLGQARLAIDAFKALVEVLERVRPTEEMAAHRGMLSQLQLAYVAALDAGTAGAADADGADVGADVTSESDELVEEPGEPGDASAELGEETDAASD